MDPEKIGKFICELRKEKGLSQYQLADMIPISRQGVSKWERGKTTPDPQTLLQLSEMFDVSINELLKGERLKENTIKQLEETTLNILDESNKKTKTIKRITTISVIIITILLLLFLSYYFINSYNSIEVYKIGNTNDKFTTTNGIFMTTNEKYYLKLGTLKNKINADIKNIKLYYKKGKKKILIIEDQDIDNITVIDSYGYQENFTREDIRKLKDNLYIEITYNENETETIKLRYRRDYTNNSLFFIRQQKELKINIDKPEPTPVVEEKKEETKKEEIKPTIQEITQKQEFTPPKQEEPKPEPQEPEITFERIINKMKEIGINANGTYFYESDDGTIVIMYYENMNQISILKDDEELGDYQINVDKYICSIAGCEEEFNKIIKENLFS